MSRWKPSRAGIRNIWEYDDQVFEFADGRLILRGANGSGKSNALALCVPFLLDGVMAASRMDSMGGGRSMKTLLLRLVDDEHATSRFRHEQRTGYTWLEFERGDDHLTIGCGARASTHRDAEGWFFITCRRPGIDLELAPGGVPLTAGGLRDELGTGAVFDGLEAYRGAVDRALYGVGPHRYRNIVEVLLVMRRPHLAGKLNLDQLSRVLSDGLPALDNALLGDVAASFEDLEAVQEDLRRLQEAHRAVQVFLPAYRRYLQAVGRGRAAAALDARARLRDARRRLAAAQAAVREAESATEALRQAQSERDDRQGVAEQRHRAVLDSPAYRSAVTLADTAARAQEARDGAEGARRRLAEIKEEATDSEHDLSDARSSVATDITKVELAFGATAEAADAARLGWTLSRSDAELADLGPRLRGGSSRRRGEIAEVRSVLRQAETARIRAEAAAETSAASAEVAERAEARRFSAAETVDGERATLAEAVAAWAAASGFAGLGAVVAAVVQVGEPGAASLADVLAVVLQPQRDGLAARQARAEDHLRDLLAERDLVEAERRRVAEERIPSPMPSPTRPASREGRRGAPLFACCDFGPDVPAEDRAGLEAALEASGLLDAWVGAEDAQPSAWDAWLRPGPRADGATLADVLVPIAPEGCGLTDDDVASVLATIALGDAGIAVTPDGRYTFGPFAGRFGKPQAEFIGVTAREELRRRRLGELDERLRVLGLELEDARRLIESITSDRDALRSIAQRLPTAAPLLASREALIKAIAAASTAVEAAQRDVAAATAEARNAAEAATHLRSTAAGFSLAATPEGLDAAERLVQAYDQQAAALVQAVTALTAGRRREEDLAGRWSQVQARVGTRQQEWEGAARLAEGLAARAEELRALLGADAEAPMRQLESIEAELAALRIEAADLARRAEAAAGERGRADQALESAAAAVTEHESTAQRASGQLDILRRPDVWAEITSSESPPSNAEEIAETAAQSTTLAADEPDDNALQRAYRTLLDDLGRGYDPGLTYLDHVGIVEVTSEAGTFPVRWLARELEAHVARQQDLLSERDKEIFERHLLTRISEALRDLLNDAEEFRDRINACLKVRPTASGKHVRLEWEVDSSDSAVRSALRLLRRTSEWLGPEEREQLRRFFATAIAQLRAENPALGYLEVLRQVLDYRAWHSFVPHVVSAGGGSKTLTRTLFRTLSGGEQAVVLHLPLFAAAAAHYAATLPDAPRLIALDEAFAGIDEGMRAELMGLLVAFDLDIVLTGHELWGAYEQVPSVMVYDLLRRPPLEGVSAEKIQWDGSTVTTSE